MKIVLVGLLGLLNVYAAIASAETIFNAADIINASNRSADFFQTASFQNFAGSNIGSDTAEFYRTQFFDSLTSPFGQSEYFRFFGNVNFVNDVSFLIGIRMKFE